MMVGLARVTDAEHIDGRVLRIEFTDGLVRELDFTGVLAGYLASIDDDAVFSSVAVDSMTGTICWPTGIDLDPDVLRGETPASSAGHARLVREYRLQSAG